MKSLLVGTILLVFTFYSAFAKTIELKPIQITDTYYSSIFDNELKNTDKIESQERQFVLQETSTGFKQPIYRGLQGDQIHLTIEDMDFTNQMFRSGPNQYYSYIPEEFTSNISTNSDIYDLSNNSFGGTIDRTLGFTSKNSNTISIRNYNIGGKGFISYNKDDLKIGALYKNINHIKTPDGNQDHTNYNQKGIYFEKNNYKFIYTRSDKIDRPDKFLKDKPRIYDIQQYIGAFKDFEATYDWTIKTSYQNFYEKVNNPDKVTNKDKINTTETNIFQIQNEYYINDNLILLTHHKYEHTDYQKYRNNNKLYETISNGIGLNYFNNYKKLKYSFNINSDYSTIDHKDFSNISLGAKIKYNNYFASISQGYKYPTIYNLKEAISDSIYEIPNSNLKQEKSIKTELGYTNKLKYLKFKGTIFYSYLTDMITREKTNILVPGTIDHMYRITNAENGNLYGANTNIIFKHDDLIIDFFTEYVYGKTNVDYISKLTPFRTDTRIEYKSFGLNHKYGLKSNTLSKADKGDIRIKDYNDGYNIFDINYKYIYKKQHNFLFSINNIFNSTGRILGSSTDFEKRYLSLKYNYYF